MDDLIVALGLFLFIEGILYALFPSKMKSMLEKLKMINDKQLRSGGIIFALIGFFIIWFINCLLYTSPSPRDLSTSRMPSSA